MSAIREVFRDVARYAMSVDSDDDLGKRIARALGAIASDDYAIDAWTCDAIRRIACDLAGDFPHEDDRKFDDDIAYEVADHLSTSDGPTLIAWLASNPANLALCDVANHDYGTWEMLIDRVKSHGRTDAIRNVPETRFIVGMGQLLALRTIAACVIGFARDEKARRIALAAFASTGAL